MYSSWAYLYLRGNAIWNTTSQGNVDCGMVKFDVSTTAKIEIVVFWAMTLYYEYLYTYIYVYVCVCIYI